MPAALPSGIAVIVMSRSVAGGAVAVAVSGRLKVTVDASGDADASVWICGAADTCAGRPLALTTIEPDELRRVSVTGMLNVPPWGTTCVPKGAEMLKSGPVDAVLDMNRLSMPNTWRVDARTRTNRIDAVAVDTESWVRNPWPPVTDVDDCATCAPEPLNAVAVRVVEAVPNAPTDSRTTRLRRGKRRPCLSGPDALGRGAEALHLADAVTAGSGRRADGGDRGEGRRRLPLAGHRRPERQAAPLVLRRDDRVRREVVEGEGRVQRLRGRRDRESAHHASKCENAHDLGSRHYPTPPTGR